MSSGPSDFSLTPGESGEPSEPHDADTAIMLADAEPSDIRALEHLKTGLALAPDDDETQYRIRMRIMERAGRLRVLDTVLEHFDWCVEKNHTDPQNFPTQIDECDLLTYYSWIPLLMMDETRIPRERILVALDAMEQRWLSEELGLGAVLEERFMEAFSSGRPELAEEYLNPLSAKFNDDPPCDVCLDAERVDFLLEQGEEAQALDLFDQMVEAEVNCDREPEAVMAKVLLPLIGAGRPEDAAKAHWLGYQLVLDDPSMLPTIARHIEFCVLTGNFGRARVLLDRHLVDLGTNTSSAFQFESLLPLAVSMEVLSNQEDTVGDIILDPYVWKDLLGLRRSPTLGSLARAAWKRARELAAEFDRRNGTGRYMRLVNKASGRLLDRFPHRLGTVEDQDLPRMAPPKAPDTVDGWLQEISWAATSADGPRRATAVAGALALDPTAKQRLTLYSMVAAAAAEESDMATLERAVRARTEAYRELGQDECAAIEEQYGTTLAGPMDVEQATQMAEVLKEVASDEAGARITADLARYALRSGDQEEACQFYLAAADLAQRIGDDEQVRADLVGASWAVPLDAEDGQLQSRLLENVEEFGPWGAQAYDVAYLRTVEQLALKQDPEAALIAARRARDLALENRAIQPLRQICNFESDLLSKLDRNREAAWVMHIYNAAAESGPNEDDVMAQVEEAKYLYKADLDHAALERLGLTRLSMSHRVDHSPAEWAALERWNGEVAMGLGFIGTAVESFERAVQRGEAAIDEAPELEDAQQAAFLGCSAARTIVYLAQKTDHPDDVHNFAERALDLAEKLHDEDPGLLAMTRAQVGRALAQIGDENGLNLLVLAEQEGRADGEAQFAAEALDARARALVDLGRREEALPLFLTAADQLQDVGDEVNAALAEYAAGTLLSQDDRDEEALSILSTALERVRSRDEQPQVRSTIGNKVVELLEAAGRTQEADELRGLL
jgi:tetratricopeptide (TPR) repeat protein